MKRPTCIATDWSKEGMGYMLLQKKCKCVAIDPRCCPGGWGLVLAGSRFCSGAESRYAPVEGEAQAIVWALENTRHYTLGNSQLYVATDHKPLVKIFGSRNLGEISNPRLARLKESTLRWEFSIMHVPGATNAGPDALSRRSPVKSESVSGVLRTVGPTMQEESETMQLELELVAMAQGKMTGLMTLEEVKVALEKDQVMLMLRSQIQSGFPPENKLLVEELRPFWRHREELSVMDGLVMYKDRVVIPGSSERWCWRCYTQHTRGCTPCS